MSTFLFRCETLQLRNNSSCAEGRLRKLVKLAVRDTVINENESESDAIRNSCSVVKEEDIQDS
jgi:hypothetical protein